MTDERAEGPAAGPVRHPPGTWLGPERGVFSTDVCARWILARAGLTPADVRIKPLPTHVIARGWETLPGIARTLGHRIWNGAATRGQPVAITFAVCAIGESGMVVAAVERDGALLPPCLLLDDVLLSETVAAAAAGQPLGRLVAHPDLGPLAETSILAVHVQRDGKEPGTRFALDPMREVHRFLDEARPIRVQT